MRHNRQAGLTLLEMLIAVTLVSMLSVGILMAMRVGLDALSKANHKLIDNRRVAGAQRVLEQEIAGFVPVKALCGAGTQGTAPSPIPFFEGQPESMRMVSTYSLQESWRGRPRLLEFEVIPGDQGIGVRLIVNEFPYTGPQSAGQTCMGMAPDPLSGMNVPQFVPIQTGPWSFVLADKLAFCRFIYLEPRDPPELERWTQNWVQPRWPLAVRVEMAPIEDNPARLRPLTVTAAIRVNRSPIIVYGDY